MSILCVDMGGSYVKAATLPEGCTLEDLRNTLVHVLPSEKFWNEHLPQQFNREIQDSLASKFEPCNALSVAISGLVSGRDRYVYWRHRGLSENVVDECGQTSNLPVCFENDALTWTLGALKIQKMLGRDIQFPCVGITLGTGVGVAFLRSESDYVVVELSFVKRVFSRLYELSRAQEQFDQYDTNERHDTANYSHCYLGKRFFTWIQKEFPSFMPEEVSSIYTLRVLAFLRDLNEFLGADLDVRDVTYIVGGQGCDQFVSSHSFELPVHVLNKGELSPLGIDPNTISLLGALLRKDDATRAVPYPSYEEITQGLVEINQRREKKQEEQENKQEAATL